MTQEAIQYVSVRSNGEVAPIYVDGFLTGLLWKSTESEEGRPLSLEEIREFQIRFVMALCKGNKTTACKMLGIDRRTLYRTLDRMNGVRRPVGADSATL